jgi:hypothetical protein
MSVGVSQYLAILRPVGTTVRDSRSNSYSWCFKVSVPLVKRAAGQLNSSRPAIQRIQNGVNGMEDTVGSQDIWHQQDGR